MLAATIGLGGVVVESKAEDVQAFEALAVSLAELSEIRGQGGLDLLQMSGMELDAVLSQNSIGAAVTGSNIVSNGAFADTHGFATVIQNSGNHVVIQNATILNLILEQ